MSETSIGVADPKSSGREISVDYDFGDNLQDAVAKFGEDVVFSQFNRNAVIALQGFVRGKLRSEVADEEIHRLVESWKPGVAQRSGKPKSEKVLDMFASMSEDAQLALLNQLRERAAAAQAAGNA